MRILFFSPHPTHDIVSEVGYSTHQRETIRAFQTLGHQVEPVIMGGTTEQQKMVVSDHGIKFRLKEWSKKLLPSVFYNALKDYQIRRFDKTAAERLELAIAAFKPDLVYERSEYMQDSGVQICRKHQVPHFLEVNAPFIEEMRHWEGPSLLHPLGHSIEKRKLRWANHVFAVSSVLRDFLADEYDANPAKIAVIPNCINPDGVLVNKEEVSVIRQKFKLTEKKVVGFVGSFFPHHGLDDLIAAFAKARAQHPNTVLLIVGGGMNEDALKRQAALQLGEDAVVFAGRVPHHAVFDYIDLMDIAVMPRSNWYGSPMKIFEYGILSKAVVAPDNGPVRDVMVHEQDGILVQPGIPALTAAIGQLLEDDALREKIGENFRNKILTHYTWNRQAEFILSHFQ